MVHQLPRRAVQGGCGVEWWGAVWPQASQRVLGVWQTTVRALKAAPSWRCPVCEAECTCPACQKAQGVFPGLPLVCEHGGTAWASECAR